VVKRRVLYFLIIVVIVFIGYKLYQHRERDLGEVMNVSELMKVHFSTQPPSGDNKDILFNHTIDDEQTIEQLKEFFNQYQVRRTNEKENDNDSEIVYAFFFEYSDGTINHWTIVNGTDSDRIVSGNSSYVYEIESNNFNYELLVELLQ
jgi:hypothetical protein